MIRDRVAEELLDLASNWDQARPRSGFGAGGSNPTADSESSDRPTGCVDDPPRNLSTVVQVDRWNTRRSALLELECYRPRPQRPANAGGIARVSDHEQVGPDAISSQPKPTVGTGGGPIHDGSFGPSVSASCEQDHLQRPWLDTAWSTDDPLEDRRRRGQNNGGMDLTAALGLASLRPLLARRVDLRAPGKASRVIDRHPEKVPGTIGGGEEFPDLEGECRFDSIEDECFLHLSTAVDAEMHRHGRVYGDPRNRAHQPPSSRRGDRALCAPQRDGLRFDLRWQRHDFPSRRVRSLRRGDDARSTGRGFRSLPIGNGPESDQSTCSGAENQSDSEKPAGGAQVCSPRTRSQSFGALTGPVPFL